MSGAYNPSIVYKEDRCAGRGCGSECEGRLEVHHCIPGTANRKLCTQDGLTVMLCSRHHRDTKYGVHGTNKKLDEDIRAAAQKAWMEEYDKPISEWVKRYGKNYLDVEW